MATTKNNKNCAIHTGTTLEKVEQIHTQKVDIPLPARLIKYGGKNPPLATISIKTTIQFLKCPSCGLVYDLELEVVKK